MLYVDGELTRADRERLEEWLAEHPESAAEVRKWRRLRQLLQRAEPEAPTEAVWSTLFDAIEVGLKQPAERVPAWRRTGLLLAAATAAAVVFAFLGLMRPASPVGDAVTDEPFPVVSAADVDIISVEAADLHALVVGEPPLRAPIVLMAPGDVAVRSLDSDGDFPDMRMQPPGDDTPMIYAPLP